VALVVVMPIMDYLVVQAVVLVVITVKLAEQQVLLVKVLQVVMLMLV
jgi:hypothetical protein